MQSHQRIAPTHAYYVLDLVELCGLAAAIREGARVLGSCWGHQLIAVALVGPQAVRRSPTPEIGWRSIEVVDDDGLLPPGAFDSFCAHLDEVVPGCHPDIQVLVLLAEHLVLPDHVLVVLCDQPQEGLDLTRIETAQAVGEVVRADVQRCESHGDLLGARISHLLAR